MGRMVDLDDPSWVRDWMAVNLIDSAEVAEIIGLSHASSVRRYKKDYGLPAPVKKFGSGRCQVWLRSEVEAWQRARSGTRRRT